MPFLILACFACVLDETNTGPGGDADTDADADADSDTDSDTDADSLPDCGAYSGIGAPGRSWTYDVRNYAGVTWTINWTITSVSASGELQLTSDATIDYTTAGSDAYDAVVTGTLDWLCDSVGLQLVSSSAHTESESGSSDDVWAYDPPNVLIPYDPTVAASWTVAGVHNGIEFATTGSSGPEYPGDADTVSGPIPVQFFVVTTGTRQVFRGVSDTMGLVYEQDGTSMPYPETTLAAFTP